MSLRHAPVLVLLLIGCRKPTATPAADGPGTVAVQWTGAVKGKLVDVGTGTWCPADSLLEVRTIRGDSGFGMALVESGPVATGLHPITPPSVPVPWRPVALAALRWVTDTAVKGFEANAGNISITEVAGQRVSGTIDVRLIQAGSGDTLRLTGTFTKVPFTQATGPCGRIGGARATT